LSIDELRFGKEKFKNINSFLLLPAVFVNK
jgi:hypothetical protein